MKYVALSFVCGLLVCSSALVDAGTSTSKAPSSSTTTKPTTKLAASSPAAVTNTTSTQLNVKSTTGAANTTTTVAVVAAAAVTTEKLADLTKNETKSVESNDLTPAATGHRAVKTRAVPGFSEHFAYCKRNSPEFDKCIKDGLNRIREFIPKGVPEYKIPSFDPIYAKEVVLKRGGPTFGYKLKLKNVRESGWKVSEVTKFKSNLKLNTVQLTQYFPDKYLEGEYEFESLILNPSSNKGRFNLSLYELNQTTTLSKPRNSKSIKVNVDVQEIGEMKLHISNLLRGRTRMENLLDRMINSPAWRPGFIFVRPFVNELVSTAFTDIYNRVFNNFDFNEILPPT